VSLVTDCRAKRKAAGEKVPAGVKNGKNKELDWSE